MSVLPIVKWPDVRLSRTCEAVSEVTGEIRALAQNMLETMYDAPGRGLAAPQVGVLIQMFVMDATWKDGDRRPQIFINPQEIWSAKTNVISSEGCLSIPGLTVDVDRASAVKIRWTDETGAIREQQFDGFAARCIQHEMDHLQGRVTLDRVDDATRAALLTQYQEVSV